MTNQEDAREAATLDIAARQARREAALAEMYRYSRAWGIYYRALHGLPAPKEERSFAERAALFKTGRRSIIDGVNQYDDDLYEPPAKPPDGPWPDCDFDEVRV